MLLSLPKYYDAPDGEECGKKIIIIGSQATLIGLMTSMYNLPVGTVPKTVPEAAFKMARFTWPFSFGAVAFASTVCVATSLRKKDDVWNHIIGAYTAGAMFGTKYKSFHTGFLTGTAFAIAAAVLKLSHRDNIELFPEAFQMNSPGPVACNYDFTFIGEYKHVK
ncbi:Uncharacterised protein g7089 [Pycnogonum litorale]